MYQRPHCDEAVQIPSNAAQRPCQAVPCVCAALPEKQQNDWRNALNITLRSDSGAGSEGFLL